MLFDEDSDDDAPIRTNNSYAKNYDDWRKKEELHKLKAKYGEESDEESTSSDDDEDGVELTEEVEKEFYTTLSCLINKDPKIYDQNVQFFAEKKETQTKSKQKSEKPVFIKDYERDLILKHHGELVDDNNEEFNSLPPVEEERRLRESFKNLDDGSDDDGILSIRKKSKEQTLQEEAEYKEWLKGQKDQIDDTEAAEKLKPLKDYWANPKLDQGEKFVRDYLLHKRFLCKEDEDYIPTYDEIVHDSDKDLSEDEAAIDRQDEFEHKYNFRFEDPDQDFIKRYPRTMEHSLRKTDDKRKLKRVEVKERKQKEKEEKMQELKRLQELKLEEINDKIEKLKEITGNSDVTFTNEDVEGDFDPEAHDKRMQALFSDNFYEGPEGEQKPEFPDVDRYLEIENWEKWQGEEETGANEAPHCEDDDFNMDCEYDPSQKSTQAELIENSRNKRKRKRKSLFAKAVSEPKPVFDPNDKTYEQYLDEYYKFDCEDIIGDIPCRFKYRKVAPNSFGLTIEEILKANDRELNKWCSIKKAVQIRPDHVEKYDQIAYNKKGSNFDLKRKILPSLFVEEESKTEEGIAQSSASGTAENQKRKGGKSKIENDQSESDAKKQKLEDGVIGVQTSEVSITEEASNQVVAKESRKSKKKKKSTPLEENSSTEKTNESNDQLNSSSQKSPSKELSKKKTKKKKKKKPASTSPSNVKTDQSKGQVKKNANKKFKKNLKNSPQGPDISDSRLTAYGINPKKFKNKIKYKQP